MMPDQLCSGDSANDTLSDMSFVVRTGVPAPRVLLFVDIYHVLVAVITTVAMAVTAILSLFVIRFIALSTPVDFLDFAFVVVVLIPLRLSAS